MSKSIHFIAIGGSAMHNLALALHDMGYNITGSDDEIYEPSRSRLSKAGILPSSMGWNEGNIHKRLDAVILGMHAKSDNPELAAAKKLGVPIYSYPEYVALAAKDQKRIVVAGSHGKTTTTAIIMHVLGKLGMEYDYLVGAQLEGFDRMVKLTNAPLIILEGDEYLSSPIDRRPKMMHYHPDIAVITGVAWDHINVFSTFEIYEDQFRQFINNMGKDTTLIYFKKDKSLQKVIAEETYKGNSIPYTNINNDQANVTVANKTYELNIIGSHNMQNIEAARNVCAQLGISDDAFFTNIQDFKGAAKRLQYRGSRGKYRVYQDFAHAPSKVKATCSAVKDWFGEEKLYAFFELHTFSSLNKDFLPLYKGALDKADKAYVVYDEHTLKMKNMPPLDPTFVKEQFLHHDIEVITDNKLVKRHVNQLSKDGNLLMMSSGTFGGLDWETIG